MGEQRIRNRLALPAQNVKRPAEIHQLAVFRALLPVHVQRMNIRIYPEACILKQRSCNDVYAEFPEEWCVPPIHRSRRVGRRI
jgi:hypothetical protein